MLVYQRVIGVFLATGMGISPTCLDWRSCGFNTEPARLLTKTRGKQQTWKCKKHLLGFHQQKKSGLNNPGTVNRLIHCGLIHWCWTAKMMSDPASFQKSKKGVSLKWIAMRNDFLDRRSENLPRLSGYIWPTKSLDDKAEWVIPQINTWVTAMADLRMNPLGTGWNWLKPQTKLCLSRLSRPCPQHNFSINISG